MKQFRIIQIVNSLAAFLFLVMGIILIMSFIFNLSLVEELQQASNFDNWKIFIIIAGIISLLVAFVFAFGAWKEFQMYDGGYNSVVAETIYILGVGVELTRPATLGKESLDVSSSSIASIFGFGYDDEFKWTYAGRKPMPRQEPLEESDKALDEQNKNTTKLATAAENTTENKTT